MGLVEGCHKGTTKETPSKGAILVLKPRPPKKPEVKENVLLSCAAQAALASWVPGLPTGSIVVPYWGSYLESDKVIPKRNYYGAFG